VRGGTALVLVLLAGAIARLAPWRQVFTGDGVRFLYDTDPLYHLLQARRALASGFSPTWFDPWLSWPTGASVLWPPLWDLVIAASVRIVFGSSPTPAQLEQVAALLPVLVGLATLPVVAALGRRLLGPGRATLAALLVALLLAGVSVSTLGRPDQHALEVLLATLVMGGFARAATEEGAWPSGLGAVLMGAATALAFWNWQGSAVALLVPGLVAALGHLVLDRPAAVRVARALLLGCGTATLLLVPSIATWGPPGALARGTLSGISLLHVAIAGSVAAFGAGLLVAQRLSPHAGLGRRLLEPALLAGAIAVAVLAGSVTLRAGVAHGLSALTASSPWYGYIGEYGSAFLGCQVPLATEARNFLSAYGLAIPFAFLAIPSLRRRWRDPGSRTAVLLLVTWAGTFLVLAMGRMRFSAYLCVPLALVAAEGIASSASWILERSAWARKLGRPALLAALTALAVGPSVAALAGPAPGGDPEPPEAARWLARQPRIPGREGVLAPWPTGHAFLYYAARPVVVSPFGTDVGDEPMAFASGIQLSSDPEQVEEALLRRRVGYLVVGDPIVNLPLDQLLVPGAPRLATVRCDRLEGPTIAYTPAALRTAGARLSLLDGGFPEGGGTPFTRLRLVHESPALGRPDAPRTSLKVFEVLPGAIVRVTGAAPGAPVRVVATVRTDSGRTFRWGAAATPGGDGAAVLRVPYAEGKNGGSSVDVSVSDGTRSARLPIAELDVETGRQLDVALRP
jgi:asparagine N-glycosylation enzyme membrane subunit Stt3